jgi:ribosome-associated protein
MIIINENLSIPDDELKFTASRSGGPGGQNVNKVSTRITLWFDVVSSPSLSNEQKGIILNRLSTRMNKEGVLILSSQKSRSQIANREAAIERFAELVRDALVPIPVRKKGRISRLAKQRRLEAKLHRSRIKRERASKSSDADY